MTRRERDFVSLFNTLWYRDFPVIPDHEEIGTRAVWTTHIASTVKQCSDLLGLFTCFETGGRTDAVIQTGDRHTWAKIEWEWVQPRNEKVNEIDKLAQAARSSEAELFVYVGYSREEFHDENIAKIERTWRNIDVPLLVFLVKFSYSQKRRHFQLLETYRFKSGNARRLRQQEALPWKINGTKWSALVNRNLPDAPVFEQAHS
jgi:hypothetical protein